MTRVGIVGLGKMGLSHVALLNAHPDVRVTGVCDSAGYALGVLGKYTELPTYGDYEAMLAEADLDAVVIATPSDCHAEMVERAIDRGLHVFCEKPLTLDPEDTRRLVELAERRGVRTQVGYHNRFLATFQEVESLLAANAIGTVGHVFGEAYGPVVLKPRGSTWRSRSTAGGGCLYDYAAHVLNLMNWYVGEPTAVGGSVLPRIFSREVEDAAFSTLYFRDGVTGQVAVNWSDESYRKMTTRITVSGDAGSIYADRQECRVYLSDPSRVPAGYEQGWNLKYTTDLTQPVWFYLRGEEYSAQIEAFVEQIANPGEAAPVNDFVSAAATDATIAMISTDARRGPAQAPAAAGAAPKRLLRRRGRKARS